MPKRALIVSVAALVLLSGPAEAQQTGRLSRLIIDLYGSAGLNVESEALLPGGGTHSSHFNSDFQTNFSQVNLAIAGQLASAPLPSPASSFTYEFDPESGVFVRSTKNFGPLFAERGESIGRGKMSFGFAYQRFTFDSIDGIDLNTIPAVFTHDDAQPGGKADVVSAINEIDITLDQATFFGTFGLTDRIDISLVIPIVSADMEVKSTTTIQRVGTSANRAVHFFGADFGSQQVFKTSGSASGIGDIHIRAKATVYKNDSVAVAGGVNLQVPSGDELDLLGSGAIGIRPFAALSTSGSAISTHLNLAYQWNGDSVLAGDLDSQIKGDVPDQMHYVAGVDVGIHEKVSVSLDIIGQLQFDSPRVIETSFTTLDGQSTFRNLGFGEGTTTQTTGAVGIKVNVVERLLVDANVLIRLDDGGLRDNFTPLVGVEYSF